MSRRHETGLNRSRTGGEEAPVDETRTDYPVTAVVTRIEASDPTPVEEIRYVWVWEDVERHTLAVSYPYADLRTVRAVDPREGNEGTVRAALFEIRLPLSALTLLSDTGV